VSKVCTTNGGERKNEYRTLARKSGGERLLGKLGHGWMYNIKMNFRAIGWGGMNWIYLAEYDRE
jgi:hypothetical protein